jgi:hypothetical protein
MKKFAGRRLALGLGLVAVLACLCTSRAEAQNVNLNPTFGTVNLRTGFLPDPFVKNLVAGGNIQTNLGGVNAWVANAPDFRVNYTAGTLPLTFYVSSPGDTTLLINLPDGTWVANDDGAGNLNPQITLPNAQSGQYDIWVGSFNQGANPQARLFVTELK